jgi:hypothetical protein
MFSKTQREMLKEAHVLIQQANRLVHLHPLPALGSGVQELTSGLSLALAGLKMILGDQ